MVANTFLSCCGYAADVLSFFTEIQVFQIGHLQWRTCVVTVFYIYATYDDVCSVVLTLTHMTKVC